MARLRFWRTDLLTRDDPGGTNFSTSTQNKITNSHIVRYTRQFEQYLPHTQNEHRAHPNLAPTKEPTVSCWRYTPTPKTGPPPGPPGSYLSRLSAHKFNKIKQLSLLFQHTSTVECRSCVVYAQDNNSLPVWSHNLSSVH